MQTFVEIVTETGLKSWVFRAGFQIISVGTRYMSANYREQSTEKFALLENGLFTPTIKRDFTL